MAHGDAGPLDPADEELNARLRFLAQLLGCDFAQGYLLSRPAEPEVVQAWVQARTQG